MDTSDRDDHDHDDSHEDHDHDADHEDHDHVGVEPDPAVASVLVTGGGTGIGAALAVELATRGCRVVISGRREDVLDGVARSSSRIAPNVGDVTDAAHRDALAAALAALPGPRAVVHAAGYFQTGLLDRLTVEQWRRSFEVNVEARWLLTRACLDSLRDGRVLFIGSDAGSSPRSGAAAYSVAQAGSETLRRALHAEWGDRGIAVGAFKPGLVDTDMVRGFMQLPATEFPARAAYDEYVADGRVASPRDVARFAVWLLLDVPAHRFTSTEWDVRDTGHHHEWSDRPLYPGARPVADGSSPASGKSAPTAEEPDTSSSVTRPGALGESRSPAVGP